MFYWQQDLLKLLTNSNEIFGRLAILFLLFLINVVLVCNDHSIFCRCFDEIFLTWNNSIEEFDTVLRTINQKHPYIYINVSINDQIKYLDVIVGHDHHDNLKIQIAHDLNVEPYALPYLSDHSPNKYQTMLRMALLRAVRCYTNVSDFANELLGLQLSFLHNRFSNDFIKNKIVSFLEEFNIPHLKIYSGEKFYNQQLYN